MLYFVFKLKFKPPYFIHDQLPVSTENIMSLWSMVNLSLFTCTVMWKTCPRLTISRWVDITSVLCAWLFFSHCKSTAYFASPIATESV